MYEMKCFHRNYFLRLIALVLQKTMDYGQTVREGILTINYFFVADNVVPVSYTHLDVYKRQACLYIFMH